jgi:hypothetical protein
MTGRHGARMAAGRRVAAERAQFGTVRPALPSWDCRGAARRATPGTLWHRVAMAPPAATAEPTIRTLPRQGPC